MDNILPFLADLCGRLKYTPTEAEMEELSKSTMIEMRLFFEAPALGISDQELFDKIMVFYRMRAAGEKKKFKLTDPLADSDRKLSKPAVAIKPVAAAAPKPVVKNEVPAAMRNAETDRRTYNKDIDIVISPGTASYSINVNNRRNQSVTLLLDFGAAEGATLTTDAPNRIVDGALQLETTVEAGARRIAGRVVPASLTAPMVIRYKVSTAPRPGAGLTEAVCTSGAPDHDPQTSTGAAAAPAPAPVAAPKPAAAAPTPAAVVPTPAPKPQPQQPAPIESKPVAAPVVAAAPAPTPAQKPKVVAAAAAVEEESDDEPQQERKNLGENLDIVIDNDGNHGYVISIDNTDPREYLVVLDMSASINLLLKSKDPKTVTVDGQTATFNVPPKTLLAVLDMPVDNFDLQMCELRYKASIRKQ